MLLLLLMMMMMTVKPTQVASSISRCDDARDWSSSRAHLTRHSF